MSHDRRDEPGPWSPLAEVEVPAGARARVRAGVEAAIDARALGRRRQPWGTLALAAVALALLQVATRAPGPADGERAIADGTRVEWAVAGGHASVLGPAHAGLVGDVVHLRDGRVDALGRVIVQGPSCAAHVDGTAQVSVAGAELVVQVFAGSVGITPPDVHCRIVELGAPAADAPRVETPAPAPAVVTVVPAIAAAPAPALAPAAAPAPVVVVVERAPARRPAPEAAPAPLVEPPTVALGASALPPRADDTEPRPDPLDGEVAVFAAARAQEATDPAGALIAWRAFRERFPRGALAHEADLHMIRLLSDAGRTDEARAAARAFLVAYPQSPRRADVLRLLGGATP